MELPIQEQLNLFQELRHRPMREHRLEITYLPHHRQHVTDDDMPPLRPLQCPEIVGEAKVLEDFFEYIQQVRHPHYGRIIISATLRVVIDTRCRLCRQLVLHVPRRVVHPWQAHISFILANAIFFRVLLYLVIGAHVVVCRPMREVMHVPHRDLIYIYVIEGRIVIPL